MHRTLKLDSSYRPIQVIDAHDAFCMIYMGRANLVESYDNKYIRSVYQKFPLPCVIAVKRYVNFSKITLNCNKANIFWRDSYTCQYCATPFPESYLTLDHVTPRSKGGPKTWENIVTACKKCNQKKGSKLPHEAGMIPIKQPAHPPSHIFHTIRRESVHDKWLPYLVGYKP